MWRARATRERNKTRGQWDKNSRLAARAAHTAKADVVEPAPGLVPDPVRRPQVPRVVEPRGAPAQHAAVTILRTDRINNCFSPIRIVPIPAPLPDIAAHIVEPPGIRSFLADRLHLVIGVSGKPGVAV